MTVGVNGPVIKTKFNLECSLGQLNLMYTVHVCSTPVHRWAILRTDYSFLWLMQTALTYKYTAQSILDTQFPKIWWIELRASRFKD